MPPLAETSEIDIGAIRPNPQQPRKNFDVASLEELRDSIRMHGVLQPILVRRAGEGYELIAGERRWRASRLAGLQTIPAVVREGVSDKEMLEVALIENLQRQDLDPLERARAIRQLMETSALTQDAVADRVGLKRPTVTNLLRLLELPDSIQDAVARGRLSMGHARALLGAEDLGTRLRLAREAEERGLSVRQVEGLVRQQHQGSRPVSGPSVVEPIKPGWVIEMEARLQERLGTRVHVRNGQNYRGSILIEYYERADLERILELVAPKPQLDAPGDSAEMDITSELKDTLVPRS
jgi:ParB family chromosome partitioning protein